MLGRRRQPAPRGLASVAALAACAFLLLLNGPALSLCEDVANLPAENNAEDLVVHLSAPIAGDGATTGPARAGGDDKSLPQQQSPALARAASGVRLSEFKAIVARAKFKARGKAKSRVIGRVERGLVERACASKPKSIALDASAVDSLGVGDMFKGSPNANPILAGLDIRCRRKPWRKSSRRPVAAAFFPGTDNAVFVIDCVADKNAPVVATNTCLVVEVKSASTPATDRAAKLFVPDLSGLTGRLTQLAQYTCAATGGACVPGAGCGEYCTCYCPDSRNNATCTCKNWHESADDPKPAPEPSNKDCFPSSMTVLRRRRQGGAADGPSGVERVSVAALELGDEVQVVLPAGGLGWSEVIVMPHADPNHVMVAHVIETASGHQVRASGNHYIYTALPRAGAAWREREAVLARHVRPGAHAIWVVEGGSAEGGGVQGTADSLSAQRLVQSRVVGVRAVAERGGYAIWTSQGVPLVSNTAPSPYTSALGADAASHAVARACSVAARVLGARHPLACAAWMRPWQAEAAPIVAMRWLIARAVTTV